MEEDEIIFDYICLEIDRINKPVSLDLLPIEVFYLIIDSMDSKDIFTHFQYVSKTIFNNCQDEFFWRQKCIKKFGHTPKFKCRMANDPRSWKQFYVENSRDKYLVVGAELYGERLLDVQEQLRANGLVNVDTANVNGFRKLPELLNYDAILFFSYCGFHQTHVGDRLADFVDAGGGVVLGTYSHCGGGNRLEGRWMKDQYDPIAGGVTNRTYQLRMGRVVYEGHPIMEDVTNFHGGQQSSHSDGPLSKHSVLIATWENGRPLVAELCNDKMKGKIVSLNFYPPSSASVTDSWPKNSDGGKLLCNALKYVRISTPSAIQSRNNLMIDQLPSGSSTSSSAISPHLKL
ncbi:hypothetical protein PPL_04706 [Heterostelium album PN500]|uniref:F-box domain-containing protein n=1 Tax=Heterostelium pallidum (strain ATCC 26659 / Pp 5 / PN500) TaxID=670386 RepID=D3B8B4_HETP5|nr:hypothetical protein PPL_04706 [Heterostelium album PN500]EFA82282.1 hypothetical protein PPL_04706 [Heterostelium album PN500]|eukprot:XP_020434399.1 hypothetical protein PPL_04706 [Heterostelium album PN500]